jgi:hypothetical protein
MMICLQILTVFWTDRIFCLLLNARGLSDVRQRETHTADPLVPEPNSFEFEMESLKDTHQQVLIKFR